MLKKILETGILLMLAAVLSVNAQSVSKTGTTAAKFLSIGVGAKANAMGAAYSAISNDASALYWNPSGIAGHNKFEAMFTYTKWFADINLNYFGVVIPAGEAGNIGFSVTHLDIGTMDVTTELSPEGTGETFTAASYAFGLSYAKFITVDFAVGATIKYVREDIYNSAAQGLAIDIGTIFTTPFYGIKFASSITNFGTKMQMDGDDLIVRYDPNQTTSGNNETNDAKLSTDEFEMPLRLMIGLSRQWSVMEDYKFTLAVDVNYPNDNKQWVNIGGEISLFQELVALRGGYKTLFLDDSQEGLTLGMGIKYDKLQYFGLAVDYAYQDFEYLADTHSFGISISF